MIYLLSDDLMDASKTVACARAAGMPIKQYKTVAALALGVEMETPTCCILDLQLPGLSIAEAVSIAKRKPNARVIAYGSHVDAERLRMARQAGCDEVMPRSQFFEEMPKRIAEWGKDEPEE
jgi:DNA-binding NarL/FixJ family response regulator